MTDRTLTVITHVDDPSIGVLEAAAADNSWSMTMVAPFRGGDPLPGVADLDALVVLGGPQSAYEVQDHPYLSDEIAYLREAHAHEVPVLALCLGSQLLADASEAVPGRATTAWNAASSTSPRPTRSRC